MENRSGCEREGIKSQISLAMCSLLDNIGFSEDIRRFREVQYDTMTLILEKVSVLNENAILTGSRAEGASLFLQSDWDFMFVSYDVVCTSLSQTMPNFTTLKAVYSTDIPPGYVRVTAVQITNGLGSSCIIQGSLVCKSSDGNSFVSSAIFRSYFAQVMAAFSLTNHIFISKRMVGASGPALTVSFGNNVNGLQGSVITEDLVIGIHFYEPKYLSRWACRQKYHGWPSKNLVEDISSMEGYIVPVGSIESANASLEWRVSYVTSENKLIRHFDNVQYKLYVLVKMITKELISPDFPAMSSYVIKNVVLWVCELTPLSLFKPPLLVAKVRRCLIFIKLCVCNNHLPNYLIPERNLISCRINSTTKKKLIQRLNFLIEKGESLYCRLRMFTKHSFLLTFVPHMRTVYGRKRDEIEKCVMLIEQLTVNVDRHKLVSIPGCRMVTS